MAQTPSRSFYARNTLPSSTQSCGVVSAHGLRVMSNPTAADIAFMVWAVREAAR